MDERGAANRVADEEASQRADSLAAGPPPPRATRHTDSGRAVPATAWDSAAALACLRRMAVCVSSISVVLVLLLLQIQMRNGVTSAELRADPSRLLDVEVANQRWTGDRAEHAGSFAFLFRTANGPARWPCGFTIRWAYNPAGADEAAIADLREAIRIVSVASGLRFAFAGTTSVVPATTSRADPSADLVVAWSTPEGSDAIEPARQGRVLAVTLPRHSGGVITSGAIVVNLIESARVPTGFGRGETRGRMFLHELGHVLGLDHVHDSTQIMAPRSSGSYPTAYGAGDLAGLRIAGCR